MIPIAEILSSITDQEKTPTLLLLISIIEQQQQTIEFCPKMTMNHPIAAKKMIPVMMRMETVPGFIQ